MMTTTRDEQQLPTCAATTVNAPAVAAMNAKLMVATSRGDCQGLKDLMNKEENATAMVVVMATNQAEAPKLPTLASIHPLLAAAACQGNWKELNFLLNRSAEARSMMPSEEFIARLAAYTATTAAADIIIEEGWAASLLMGVTVEGNTPLHLVVANGDGNNYKDCADLILGKGKHLLFKQNKKGDTPLHCAARARKSEMVCHLIDLARGDGILEGLLRTENNSKETALHQAVLVGDNDMVKRLLEADPELACFPKQGGTSPMYLAILLKKDEIANTLHDESKDKPLSYSGPNGQNALHAAVMRGPEVTRKVLEWNKHLATESDEKGSTPLHFAAGLNVVAMPITMCRRRVRCVWSPLLEANEAAVYQSDKDGVAPIHVAASVGANRIISMLVTRCGTSAGLRDAKGRTFLHVAVVEKNAATVYYACSTRNNPSLAWILNMQDDDGNAALHLAVQGDSLEVFYALFGNPQVNLDLINNKGQTPLDIARNKIPPSFSSNWNSDFMILMALKSAGANSGVCRQDHLKEMYNDIHGLNTEDYQTGELEKLKDSTQSLSIGSVLIATVTFGAAFALPGGYKQDDHTDGGTPTLAGKLAFHAFMMANTIAFTCASMATIGFMSAGSALRNLVSRKKHFSISIPFLHFSITALSAAFALGVYTVLAPVAPKIAFAIGFMSPLVVIYNFSEYWVKWARLAIPFYKRMGLFWTLRKYTAIIVGNIVEGTIPIHQHQLQPQ